MQPSWRIPRGGLIRANQISSMNKEISYAIFIARIYIPKFRLVIINVNTINNQKKGRQNCEGCNTSSWLEPKPSKFLLWTAGWPTASQANTIWTWLQWEFCKLKIARVALLHSKMSQQEWNWTFACVAVDRRMDIQENVFRWALTWKHGVACADAGKTSPGRTAKKTDRSIQSHSNFKLMQTWDLARAACLNEPSPFFHVDASSTVNRWTSSESHPDEQTARPQASYANTKKNYIAQSPWLWIKDALFSREREKWNWIAQGWLV